MQVALVDLDTNTGEKLSAELNAKYGSDRTAFIKCNVTKEAELEHAFSHTFKLFGRLDIVANNAGIAREPDWQLVIDINLTAVVAGSRLAITYMSAPHGNGGVIINTASMGGLIPMPYAPVYAATKAAVIQYSRSLGQAHENIRVNAICPSFTDTALVAEGKTMLPTVFGEVVAATGPLLSPELIATSMIAIVEDDSKNAAVMRVTNARGVDYQSYDGFLNKSTPLTPKL
ncbi:15-hydroxyprostaglandin dehydrogenase [Capsaspora owczarzaki ATCC 30864]|uniref:15-hydroxyprostaglandin dehydrogenase n=1 Tax=Capsaspora owczarzaki (strain ATCC 30864) TaxID=595528 RepID=A0A0D2WV57_CAPO3|nr:15-hydroxyprostaglandin dehydrogenase [Capsaspora owczarzaki ATCC 30864]